ERAPQLLARPSLRKRNGGHGQPFRPGHPSGPVMLILHRKFIDDRLQLFGNGSSPSHSHHSFVGYNSNKSLTRTKPWREPYHYARNGRIIHPPASAFTHMTLYPPPRIKSKSLLHGRPCQTV